LHPVQSYSPLYQPCFERDAKADFSSLNQRHSLVIQRS
jgi:hypothetical protein